MALFTFSLPGMVLALRPVRFSGACPVNWAASLP